MASLPCQSGPTVPAKIFCGGLSDITTNTSLRTHFSPYGEIVDSVVLTEKTTGRSRGFGFITFASEESVDAVLASPQIVDGKEIDCKRAVPRGAIQTNETEGDPGDNKVTSSVSSSGAVTNNNSSGTFNATKIFVGGLPQSCTDEKLREHFGKYGMIKNLSVMVDRDTNRHRGFGFVEYESPESVEEVMRHYYDHQIDNKWVECKKALPREIMAGGVNSNIANNRIIQTVSVPQISGYAEYYRNSYMPIHSGVQGQQMYGRYGRHDPRYMYASYGYAAAGPTAHIYHGYTTSSLPISTPHINETPQNDGSTYDTSAHRDEFTAADNSNVDDIGQQHVGVNMAPRGQLAPHIGQRPPYTSNFRPGPYTQGRYAPTGAISYSVPGAVPAHGRVRGIY
ncbi:RNA recognition family protein [Cryptosporidium andersoni]|uniref:RNA recognition family protein n=1 Tax=Cryptosporidium andersoni TaxID=117008 RepID=A0A1J4MV38_9CRYT|nr:RNA recognition family protein [Cryptosporidium andersoni]